MAELTKDGTPEAPASEATASEAAASEATASEAPASEVPAPEAAASEATASEAAASEATASEAAARESAAPKEASHEEAVPDEASGEALALKADSPEKSGAVAAGAAGAGFSAGPSAEGGQGEPVIVIEGLTKCYGRETVVDSLDLTVREGEIFGFLGPNGAGKTTTLLMLLGLSLPSEGSVRVLGLDPVQEPLKVKSQVGYLAENMGFYGDLTARENLFFVAALNRLKDPGDKIAEVLELVGLAGDADRQVSEYSRGMRQRLGFAEVLVKDPKIAFLDEPTLGLDPDGIATMLEMITRLPKERGLTVILSSHLLHLVERVATRVGILRKGRLLAQGTVSELCEGAGLAPSLEAVYSYYFHRGEEAA
ncbi:MAG: ABC transporter ATP-binding protein [Deltaproteobacteria bacterium]|jgi:ABC-2 type transport system ATP-binding protein|nr:ABC transporter ATP-binding protein [Deltaproteobacteria bacterium]